MASTVIKKKVVIVGDGASGKTSLLLVFFKDEYPQVYVPTVFENFVTQIEVNNKLVELALWDTAGQDDYDRLRSLSYPNTDVVLICYSIESRTSLINVVSKWVPEVNYFCPGVPIILVGNKKDLRQNTQIVKTHKLSLLAEISEKFSTPIYKPDIVSVCVIEQSIEHKDSLVESNKSHIVIENSSVKNFSDELEKQMLTYEEGLSVAESIEAFAFLECSAKSRIGIREVFETAVNASVRDKKNASCAIL
ncbi:ras-like GTP-binding protein rhoA isoform X2 [Daktulosphaira vitifoliae]|nr:ras-like GTP-binding protein rhoA isoform X2 [Daktulosphaira vitifoliae]